MYLDSGPEKLAVSEAKTHMLGGREFYLPGIAVPDSLVASYVTDIQKPSEHVKGTVYTDGATMTDGHTHAILRGVPNEPICDFSLVMTSAWLTSVRGHNRHTVEHFMRLGIPIIAIGAEGSYRDNQKLLSRSGLERFANVSITESAHNIHEILNSVDDLVGKDGVNTKEMVVLGESRGGMIAEAIIAFAKTQGRLPIYSDLTAPCFPDGLNFGDIPEMLLQGAREPIELLKSIGSLTFGRLIHYPATIDPHPLAVAYNIAAIPALLSEATGDITVEIPRLHNQHITAFDHDVMGGVDGWRKKLKNHPNVRIVAIEGAHVSIAHPKTFGFLVSRIMQLVTEARFAGTNNPAEIDFSSVHLDDGEIPIMH